jgi:O-antigen/teichoic acid export membrane protein
VAGTSFSQDREALRNLIQQIREKLGPLAWASVVVFAITRCGDIVFLLTKLYLGRYLSPDDFGAIDPLNSAVLVMCLPVSILFTATAKSISRLNALEKIEQRRSLMRDMIFVAILGSLVTGVLVYIFRGFVLSRLSLRSAAYAAVIVPMFAVAWWRPMCNAIIRGTQRYWLLILPMAISPIIILLLSVFFIGYLGWGLWGALMGQLSGWALWIIAFIWCIRPEFRTRRVRYAEEKKVIRESIVPIAILLTTTTLLGNFDKLFIRNFITSESGGYGAVVTLGSVPALIIGAVVFVVFPLAAAEHATGQGFKRFLLQALAMGFCVTATCAIGFWLFGYQIMELWRHEFAAFSRYLWLYALAMGLHGMVMTFSHVEVARHEHGSLWVLVLATLLMCGLIYFGRSNMTIGRILVIMNITYLAVLGAMVCRAIATTKTRS